MESGPLNQKIDHIEISSVNIWIIVYASFWTCVNFLGLVDVKMQKEEKKKKLQPDQNATKVSEKISFVFGKICI